MSEPEHPPLPSYQEGYAQGLKEGIEIGEASKNLVILDLEKEVNQLKTVLGTFRVLVDSYEQTPTTYVRHDHADQDEAPARGSSPGPRGPGAAPGGSDLRHERTDHDDPEEAGQEEEGPQVKVPETLTPDGAPPAGSVWCVNGTYIQPVED